MSVDLSNQRVIGRTGTIRALGVRGTITTFVPGSGETLVRFEDADGEPYDNVRLAEIDLDAPARPPAAAPAHSERADLSDLSPAAIGRAVLVALARNEPIDPIAIRRLAETVVADRRR